MSFASWTHILRKYINSPNIEQNQSDQDQRCEYFSPYAFSLVDLILTSFYLIQQNSNNNIDISCNILNATFQSAILYMTANKITSPNMPSAILSNSNVQEESSDNRQRS